MPDRTVLLEDLGDLKQGPTLSRYLDQDGPLRRVLQVGNLGDLFVEARPDDRSERVNEARTAEHRVKPGQVLISLRGSALKAAVVPARIPDAIVSNSLTTLLPDLRQVDPYFVVALLNSEAMQQQVAPLFTGMAIQGIPLTKFRKLPVRLPSLPQQQVLGRAFLAMTEYRKAVDDVIRLRREELQTHLQPFVIQERG